MANMQYGFKFICGMVIIKNTKFQLIISKIIPARQKKTRGHNLIQDYKSYMLTFISYLQGPVNLKHLIHSNYVLAWDCLQSFYQGITKSYYIINYIKITLNQELQLL